MRGIVVLALIFSLACPALPVFAAKGKKGKKDLLARFEKLDTNNDGQLSKDEFLGKKKGKKGAKKGKAKKGKAKKENKKKGDGQGKKNKKKSS